MNTIYLPTFAFFKGDVQNIVRVLEDEVLKKHPDVGIGLEIGGRIDHFSKKENLEKIAENINEVAKGIPVIVHGFAGLEVYEVEGQKSDFADMSKKEGFVLLQNYIELAKEVGSEYVHVHGGAGYQKKAFLEGTIFEKTRMEWTKEKYLQRVRKNLVNLLSNLKEKDSKIKIGIENLPSPSCCDFEIDEKIVWRDYVERIEDCMEVVKGTDLGITFDAAHYGTNRNGYIDLVEGVSGTFDTKRGKNHLYHLHVGDCTGYWEPGKSRAFDGITVGDGRIGKDSFANFFRYIKENHPEMGICIEVQNKDFSNPTNTIESIHKICDWLRK